MQADTIIPGAGQPQAWDRYAYSLNNPVRYTDPSGHCAICKGIAILAGIGIGYLSSHLLGSIPDYRGVNFATAYVTDKDAIVGAAIAVQSEYYGPWDIREFAPNGENSGLGIAQVTDSEMTALGLPKGDQENPEIAVQALVLRIDNAVNACHRCVDDTDRFIVAALAQNGSGFGIKTIQQLPLTDGRINWDQVMLSQGRGSSDPLALLRQSATGMNYSTQFMLKLYSQDVLSLINKGFALPDKYKETDWNEIQRLIYLGK